VQEKAGRNIAAGMTKEVTFEPIAGTINARIDEADGYGRIDNVR
jgi:hypothetical protein